MHNLLIMRHVLYQCATASLNDGSAESKPHFCYNPAALGLNPGFAEVYHLTVPLSLSRPD